MGCKQVYLLLDENNLCSYYQFDKNPGIKVKGKFVSERFAYLEDESVIDKLVQFRSETQINVSFSLPQMHCASCIYLLENLHRIDAGVISSQANFQKKEVFISFNPTLISLRKVVELLSFIGYEPFISLQDTKEKPASSFNRKRIFRLGVAGFCFSNIMMLSFPEYFSGGHIEQDGLKETFNWIIFGLSLPVLFYAASSFFVSAWKGLRQKDINIDVPITLAIVITFGRSYYEIISGTGAGYLDSGTGIIFFMLIGRWFQDKTYDSLAFDRDYHAYFPLGVTVLRNAVEENIPATKLLKGDIIIVRHEEMIPADAVLISGDACVDYSFVSGENAPVSKHSGDLLYAGGKQTGSAIKLQVVKEASQSYITRLWNNQAFSKDINASNSFIHPWSRYFTAALFTVAISAAIYWYYVNPANLWPAVTAVLIVACPCSLLLSATFTFGNMLRIFGRQKLYLKNAQVIESLAGIDTIVFDKTGTITQNNTSDVSYTGKQLSEWDKSLVKNAASHSSHHLSKLVGSSLHVPVEKDQELQYFKEYAGRGIDATVDHVQVKLGAAEFINEREENSKAFSGSRVYVMIDQKRKGFFEIQNKYRDGFTSVVDKLQGAGYDLHVLSGDNDSEKMNLERIFHGKLSLHFNCTPQDKLDYIKNLQASGKKVLMIGDGLNDAGALMQSDAGIAVSDHAARFTPACDAIIDGNSVQKLFRFLQFAKAGKHVVTASFILSILYNFVGLSFAVQATLSPMVAAILMPASSISIVLLVSFLSSLVARRKGL
jgi:Cu+-exporting ATPase